MRYVAQVMEGSSIGTAIESYSVDNNIYPIAASATALALVLEPIYIKKMPLTDGWNSALIYTPSSTSGAGYTIKSVGKGNQVEGSPAGGKTQDFTKDIIFVDGQFTQWPEGVQQ